MPILRGARLTISWVSISRPYCGASFQAPARPGESNPLRFGLSASANWRSKRSQPRNIGRSKLIFLRPAGDFSARLTHLDGKKLSKLSLKNEAAAMRARGIIEGGKFSVRERRKETSSPPPGTAVYYFNTATGSLAQTWLCSLPDNENRDKALYEGVSVGGRDGRPYYLYANGRRHHGGGSDRRVPRCYR